MNEDVFGMIDTLHARLEDVQDAVENLSCEALGFAQKLDKIDDKLYLLQREIEAMDSAEQSESTETAQGETASTETMSNASSADESHSESNSSFQNSTSEEESDISGDSSSQKPSGQRESEEIISDDMKENLADAGRVIGNIYRDGKEVITELSGTMGELKDIFNFGKKH